MKPALFRAVSRRIAKTHSQLYGARWAVTGAAWAPNRTTLLLLALLAASAPAFAQQPSDPAQSLYRWTAPTAEQQLAADQTVVPPGMGAVLVPAMTSGVDEPETLVYQAGQRIASGENGRRIVLAPGSYVLRIGSAPLDQMVSVPVEVTANNTTLVPVTWSAMVIEVVDRNNVPHRGSYELIQVSDRQPYTVGFGADTLIGEKIRTTLLPPGLFRIVRPGANYRARTDFSTVVAPAGQVVYFKLVLDPDDGHLLGAGVVPPEEVGIVPAGTAWTRRMTLGLGVPIAASSNVVGASNQTSIGFTGTFDTYLIYNKGKNYSSTVIELEAGFVRIDPENTDPLPTQKTLDRLRFEQLYTRFLNPRVGPYVRFGVLTNMFESRVLVTEPTAVTKKFLDGTQTVNLLAANDDFKVGGAFAPVLLREGAGVNVRLLRGRVSYLDWRGGLGFRQSQFNGAFTEESAGPRVLVYREVDDFNQEGLETTVVGTVRVSRLLLNTNFDLFADFNEFGEPTLDWRNTFSYRLTGDLSIDYKIDILRQPQVTTDTQLTQNLLFRYSWGN
jgi:hypothetical protein